jgi:hypothetical protein
LRHTSNLMISPEDFEHYGDRLLQHFLSERNPHANLSQYQSAVDEKDSTSKNPLLDSGTCLSPPPTSYHRSDVLHRNGSSPPISGAQNVAVCNGSLSPNSATSTCALRRSPQSQTSSPSNQRLGTHPRDSLFSSMESVTSTLSCIPGGRAIPPVTPSRNPSALCICVESPVVTSRTGIYSESVKSRKSSLTNQFAGLNILTTQSPPASPPCTSPNLPDMFKSSHPNGPPYAGGPTVVN